MLLKIGAWAKIGAVPDSHYKFHIIGYISCSTTSISVVVVLLKRETKMVLKILHVCWVFLHAVGLMG